MMKIPLTRIKKGLRALFHSPPSINFGRILGPLKNKRVRLMILLAVMGIYLLGGIALGLPIYKFKQDNRFVRFGAVVYPFPLAFVDRDFVWVKDYFSTISYLRHYSETAKQEIPKDADLKQKVIAQMVETSLVKQAARRLSVVVTTKDIDAAMQKVTDQSGGKEQLQKVLKELYGMTPRQFRRLVEGQLYKDKVQQEKLVQVNVRHILVADEAKANKVIEELKGGKSFEDAAKERSEDANSRDKGGSLGWIMRGATVAPFDEAAFKLKPGELSLPVKSEFGFHIIRVDEKKGEVNLSLGDWMKQLEKDKRIIRFLKP